MTGWNQDSKTIASADAAIAELKKSPHFLDSFYWMKEFIEIELEDRVDSARYPEEFNQDYIEWLKEDDEMLEKHINIAKDYIAFHENEISRRKKDIEALKNDRKIPTPPPQRRF